MKLYIAVIFVLSCFHLLSSLFLVTGQLTIAVDRTPEDTVCITLSCTSGEWIHVISTQELTTMTRDAFSNVGLFCRRFRSGLLFLIGGECNGEESCSYLVDTTTLRNSTRQVLITYECVYENRFSACDNTVTNAVYRDPIHIHSPGYPSSLPEENRCECSVRGNNLLAELYSVRFFSAPGSARLAIDSEKNSFLATGDFVVSEDTSITDGATTLSLSYQNNDVFGQNFWLQVSGTGQMIVSCDTVPLLPVTAATSTRTATSQPAQTSPPSSTGSSSMTTASSAASSTQPPVTSATSNPGPAETSTSGSTGPTESVPDPTYHNFLVAVITGGVLSFVLLSALILTLCFLLRRRRKQTVKPPPVMVRNSAPHVQKQLAKRPPVMKPNTSSHEQESSGGYDNSYLELVNTRNTYDNPHYVTPYTEDEGYEPLHLYEDVKSK